MEQHKRKTSSNRQKALGNEHTIEIKPRFENNAYAKCVHDM